jgi:hypothetical protein
MVAELALRFVLGGLIVSLFSISGELWQPTTFSGIFGAAPSVALASLALAFWKQGPGVVSVLGRSMVIGSIALYGYGAACVFAMKRGGATLVWLAVDGVLWVIRYGRQAR